VPAISLIVSEPLSEALLFDTLDNNAVASATNRVSMVDAVNSCIKLGSGVPFGLKWSASANAPPTTDPSRKERGPNGFLNTSDPPYKPLSKTMRRKAKCPPNFGAYKAPPISVHTQHTTVWRHTLPQCLKLTHTDNICAHRQYMPSGKAAPLLIAGYVRQFWDDLAARVRYFLGLAALLPEEN
jgi:hypothetical protein